MSAVVNPDLIKKFILAGKPMVSADQIGTETDLFLLGALDSYSTIQFVLSLETNLGITFDYRDLSPARLQSIRSILELLTSKYGCRE